MRHLISRMCICHMKTGFAGVQFAALFPLIDRTLIKSASWETESISQSRVTCFIVEYFSSYLCNKWHESDFYFKLSRVIYDQQCVWFYLHVAKHIRQPSNKSYKSYDPVSVQSVWMSHVFLLCLSEFIWTDKPLQDRGWHLLWLGPVFSQRSLECTACCVMDGCIMCPSDRGFIGAADETSISLSRLPFDDVSSCLVCSYRGPGSSGWMLWCG